MGILSNERILCHPSDEVVRHQVFLEGYHFLFASGPKSLSTTACVLKLVRLFQFERYDG